MPRRAPAFFASGQTVAFVFWLAVAIRCAPCSGDEGAPRAAVSGVRPAADASSQPLPRRRGYLSHAAGMMGPPVAEHAPSAQREAVIAQPVYKAAMIGREHRPLPPTTDNPFIRAELDLPRLVAEVVARNRSLEAMRAAWRAANERYPQAIALDDPVFTSLFAPGSFASTTVAPSYVLGGAQKIPWAGKRPLRGQVARDESRAAFLDAEDMRLEVIEAAGLAYFDYYLVRRHLALNIDNTAKLRQFREIASSRYEAKLAPQQDVLQADVELAELGRRRIELDRLERITIARINALLHRVPDAYLPPPPGRIDAPPLALSAERLRLDAIARRPDLAALASQLRAEHARIQLANKDFLPDFELFGRYDSFWQPAATAGPQRGQVGVNLNVPLYRQKREAAVREAEWRWRRRRAEYEQRIDTINAEVQTAYERFDESQQTVEIYASQILPAAGKNVQSAMAAYISSGGDFLRLVAAQRQLIVFEERYQASIADYHRRRVELERVVGAPLAPPTRSR